MKDVESITGGVTAGLMAAIAAIDMVWFSFLLPIVLANVSILAGIHVYICREWQLKLAVTPLVVAGLCHLYHAYTNYPTLEISQLTISLYAIGILTTLAYVIWNKRKPGTSKKDREDPPLYAKVVK